MLAVIFDQAQFTPTFSDQLQLPAVRVTLRLMLISSESVHKRHVESQFQTLKISFYFRAVDDKPSKFTQLHFV